MSCKFFGADSFEARVGGYRGRGFGRLRAWTLAAGRKTGFGVDDLVRRHAALQYRAERKGQVVEVELPQSRAEVLAAQFSRLDVR